MTFDTSISEIRYKANSSYKRIPVHPRLRVLFHFDSENSNAGVGLIAIKSLNSFRIKSALSFSSQTNSNFVSVLILELEPLTDQRLTLAISQTSI